MSVRMRHTKGHTGNRRSHHALTQRRLSKCPECGAPHIRHQVCMACGKYRGRQVIDVVARDARIANRKEAKLKLRGQDPDTVASTESEAPQEEKGE